MDLVRFIHPPAATVPHFLTINSDTMNATQKKKIAKALGNIQEAQELLNEVLGDIQEVYDNKSERFQESEKGEEMSNDISTLEDAINNADYAIDSLGNFEDEN